MASIEHRKRSLRVVAYVDGEKITFPLGRVPKKTADRFAANIDTLLHERRCNLPLSREVSRWLADLDEKLYDLLAAKELVEPRETCPNLNSFIARYIQSRTDVTERRLAKLRIAGSRLVEFFGDLQLEEVTPGGADEYARWLSKQLAAATAQKECQIAAQFFRHAYRKRLIERSPFDGVSTGKATNSARRVFVTTDHVARVMDCCPDWQWRTVFALARFGGLRCPSEVALLKWSDVHWDSERMTVTSPKTKRYGYGSRQVPIFPELRHYLDEAFERAADGEQWVVPMLAGDGTKNLGTTFRKIVQRAGLEPWPKPFQNCRSSRQTELEKTFPTHVVCAWLGNSPSVAHRHYLTVTDEDFAAAVVPGDKRGMQSPAPARSEAHEKTRTAHFVRENESFSDVVDVLENAGLAVEGFEPTTRGL